MMKRTSFESAVEFFKGAAEKDCVIAKANKYGKGGLTARFEIRGKTMWIDTLLGVRGNIVTIECESPFSAQKAVIGSSLDLLNAVKAGFTPTGIDPEKGLKMERIGGVGSFTRYCPLEESTSEEDSRLLNAAKPLGAATSFSAWKDAAKAVLPANNPNGDAKGYMNGVTNDPINNVVMATDGRVLATKYLEFIPDALPPYEIGGLNNRMSRRVKNEHKKMIDEGRPCSETPKCYLVPVAVTNLLLKYKAQDDNAVFKTTIHDHKCFGEYDMIKLWVDGFALVYEEEGFPANWAQVAVNVKEISSYSKISLSSGQHAKFKEAFKELKATYPGKKVWGCVVVLFGVDTATNTMFLKSPPENTDKFYFDLGEVKSFGPCVGGGAYEKGAVVELWMTASYLKTVVDSLCMTEIYIEHELECRRPVMFVTGDATDVEETMFLLMPRKRGS